MKYQTPPSIKTHNEEQDFSFTNPTSRMRMGFENSGLPPESQLDTNSTEFGSLYQDKGLPIFSNPSSKPIFRNNEGNNNLSERLKKINEKEKLIELIKSITNKNTEEYKKIYNQIKSLEDELDTINSIRHTKI